MTRIFSTKISLAAKALTHRSNIYFICLTPITLNWFVALNITSCWILNFSLFSHPRTLRDGKSQAVRICVCVCVCMCFHFMWMVNNRDKLSGHQMGEIKTITAVNGYSFESIKRNGVHEKVKSIVIHRYNKANSSNSYQRIVCGTWKIKN